MTDGTGERVAWFHPFSGVAGDMALGALIDAGADPSAVEGWLRRLPLGGWELEIAEVRRGGLAGVHAKVVIDDRAHRHHRRAANIVAMVAGAGLPARAAARAVAVFDGLARAEGRLHGVPPGEVTFHEVGAVDSIVDVVGVCVALELLGADHVECGPLSVGTGTIRAAHGVLPNPPPAAVEVLAEAGAPVRGVDVGVELTTPTGAALMAVLARRFGPLPAMRLRAQGFGAGTRELEGRPNLVQVVIGEAAPAVDSAGPAHEAVAVLETTVDDVTGEILGHVLEQAIDAGALDAWAAPVTMKKGRPGHVISVLARPGDEERLRDVLMAETGTLGVRVGRLDRWAAARRIEEVTVDGQRIRVKVGPARAKAEHDDVVRAARELGRPAREVAASAEAVHAAGADAGGAEARAAAGREASLRHSDQ